MLGEESASTELINHLFGKASWPLCLVHLFLIARDQLCWFSEVRNSNSVIYTLYANIFAFRETLFLVRFLKEWPWTICITITEVFIKNRLLDPTLDIGESEYLLSRYWNDYF